MGKTTEALMEEHGSDEYVVIHNLVMVRDVDDAATDPKDYVYAPASRGDRVTLDGRAAERLLAEGAIAKPGSDHANFAEAGMRDPSVMGLPPSATQLAPESERTQVTKAVVGDRFGDPAALMRLDLHQLKHVALAFGVPFKASDDKGALAKRILGEDVETIGDQAAAVEARGVAVQQTDLHPDDQVEGREESFKDQQGRGSESSSSSSESSSSGPNATESARTFAAEHGIDLATVQGTGGGGRITQADVVRYQADRDASGA